MTATKRAKLVEIARAELVKRPTEHDADPKRYEPPEWLLAALEAAFDAGYESAQPARRPAFDSRAR